MPFMASCMLWIWDCCMPTEVRAHLIWARVKRMWLPPLGFRAPALLQCFTS